MKTITAADGDTPCVCKSSGKRRECVVDALCVAGRRLNFSAVVPLILLVVGGW